MKTLEQLCKEIFEDAALREAYEKAAEASALESFLTEQGAPSNVDAFMEAMMQQSGIAVLDGDMEKVVGGAGMGDWLPSGGVKNRGDVHFRFGRGQSCWVRGHNTGTIIEFWPAQRPGDPLWYPRYKLRCPLSTVKSMECWQEDLAHL